MEICYPSSKDTEVLQPWQDDKENKYQLVVVIIIIQHLKEPLEDDMAQGGAKGCMIWCMRETEIK